MITDPVQVDKVSGQTTTGHEWDGIRELNTPLPRWWLWLFYICIAFSFVYWILYPAWPLVTGFTPGILGHTNRGVGGGGHRVLAVGARPDGGGPRKGERDGDRRRSEAAGDRACAGQGRLRRQLRAVPRLGRPGPAGLSQPDGRPLAVGRHARPDPDRRSPTAFARTTRTRIRARCPRSARTES